MPKGKGKGKGKRGFV